MNRLRHRDFKRGEDVANNGLVGLSFDIQNSGFDTSQDLQHLNDATRTQSTLNRLVPIIANLEQNLYSTSRNASVDRTSRAFVILEPDEWTDVAIITQMAALVMPRMQNPLAEQDGDARLNISNNLFYALNNARIPVNSFTAFETGVAGLTHSDKRPESAADTPTATYQGVWLGFSPVRDTSFSTTQSFVPVGPREFISEQQFAQGGNGSPFQDASDVGLTIFDSIDESITEVNFQNIDDLFVQMGLGVSSQEAVRTITSTEENDFHYVPHLSFNGNVTTGISVLRYYLGVIVDDTPNSYIGADYTLSTEDGWNGYGRIDLYTEPDTDYRSEIEAQFSKGFQIDADSRLLIGASGIAELGDPFEGQDVVPTFDLDGNRIEFSGLYKEGPVEYTVRHRITNNVDEGRAQGTTFGLAYSSGSRFSMSAKVTPYSTESDYINALAGLTWRVTEQSTSPLLQMKIARAQYGVGTDSFGNEQVAFENILQLVIQARF